MDLLENVKSVLIDAHFSTYAINTFLTLLQNYEQNPQTAKDISNSSNVPLGRIYEVLEELKTAGLIEVIESNPKRYRMIPLNQALYNLVTTIKKENQKKTNFLITRAKEIENEMLRADRYLSRDKTQVFLRTAFNTKDIFRLYLDLYKEASNEILINGFLDENTPKVLRNAGFFFNPLREVADRGVHVRMLWCSEFDARPLSDIEKNANAQLVGKLLDTLRRDLQIPADHPHIEFRFTPQSIPSYVDVFDQNHVIFKLRNPLQPYQVFGCVCLVDPSLALELHKRFNAAWLLGTASGE